MHNIRFKAQFAHASKNEDDGYYIVGLAEDEFDFEQYVMFQKSYQKEDSGDVFIELNGDQCINCCSTISIDTKSLMFTAQDTHISIDIESITLPENFINYLKEMFGTLIER